VFDVIIALPNDRSQLTNIYYTSTVLDRAAAETRN